MGNLRMLPNCGVKECATNTNMGRELISETARTVESVFSRDYRLLDCIRGAKYDASDQTNEGYKLPYKALRVHSTRCVELKNFHMNI